MSTGIRRQMSIGLAGVLPLVTIVTALAIAVSAGAGPNPFCGGRSQPPCPPPPSPPCGLPGTASCPGILLDTYINTSNGDNIVRLINPSSSSGNVCAMIYVFNAQEQMGECCGCPLSPQKLSSFSVENQLSQNWSIPGPNGGPQFGMIEVVAAAPDALAPVTVGVNRLTNGQGCAATQSSACNGGCDPTNVPGYTAQREFLKGYILHNQTPGIPEVPLLDAGDGDLTTLVFLQVECGAVVVNSGGKGICTCP
jgi:hypothetical protein